MALQQLSSIYIYALYRIYCSTEYLPQPRRGTRGFFNSFLGEHSRRDPSSPGCPDLRNDRTFLLENISRRNRSFLNACGADCHKGGSGFELREVSLAPGHTLVSESELHCAKASEGGSRRNEEHLPPSRRVTRAFDGLRCKLHFERNYKVDRPGNDSGNLLAVPLGM
jgi:hypothetical protein